MSIGLIIGLVITIIALYLVRIARPWLPPDVSDFELSRAAKAGESWAVGGLSRRAVYPFARNLNALVFSILLFVLNGLLALAMNLVVADLITLAVGIVVLKLSYLRRSIGFGERAYGVVRPLVERLYERRKLLFFVPYLPLAKKKSVIRSEPELLRAVDDMDFLGEDRRTLVHSALEFTGLTVADGMSGRRSIRAIDKGEVLGPLVLDDLYKTGRRLFVVTDGSLDDIVGILHLDRLTSLDLKDTPTAFAAMTPEVRFIDADAPITDALALLRQSEAPFLVVRRADKTVGLLGMDNILRCLFEAN